MRFRFLHQVTKLTRSLPLSHEHQHQHQLQHQLQRQRRFFAPFHKRLQTTPPPAGSSSNGSSGRSKGNAFLVPGATAATLLMLAALHARRLYSDKKVEEAREKGIELEFQPDAKASFMKMLPLRPISRAWGSLTDIELPVWLRPRVYKAWARAFHSNLEEIALPLEKYASLREFITRTLKEGSRPINPDPHCLVSPVDGIILRFGELKGSGAMIEQVKGFSYPVCSLLGNRSVLPMITNGDTQVENGKQLSNNSDQQSNLRDNDKKSWWKVSLASPTVGDTASTCPAKGLYYCVIYLGLGDYHRIHSPADWNVLACRHFPGRLFPVNERATRTIRNLYIENERVVLEGVWQEGFMAMAAVGATTTGSIQLSFEPDLRTNRPRKSLLRHEPPEERVYEPEGVGKMIKKGDEVAAFNAGSTVVLVFQAPTKQEKDTNSSSEFRFNVKNKNKIRVGESLGSWHNL